MSLNLATLALAIFVVCAGFVLLRGGLKILLGCLVLGSSAWVGLHVWQLAPEFVKACFGQHISWLATALPVVAFLIVFLVGRFVVRLLASPFQSSSDQPRPPLTLARLLGVALFTLIPTALVISILAILIYHAGSVAEIRQSIDSSEPAAPAALVHDLKDSLLTTIPPAWLEFLDPLIDPQRLALAKAITQQSQPRRPAVIDPLSGKPIPRAIIVDDPELQNLARDGKFATLLRSPLLTKALADPKVQAFLQTLQR